VRTNAAAKRDGDSEQPARFRERADAISRLTRRGSRERPLVLGMDDPESRSRFGGRLTIIVGNGIIHAQIASGHGSAAVRHIEAMHDRRVSDRVRWSRPRPRVAIDGSQHRRAPAFSRAARALRQHDKIGELSDPSLGHQLQVPTVAIVGRDSPPSAPPPRAGCVIRHQGLPSDHFCHRLLSVTVPNLIVL
jgi:hypothetical protein